MPQLLKTPHHAHEKASNEKHKADPGQSHETPHVPSNNTSSPSITSHPLTLSAASRITEHHPIAVEIISLSEILARDRRKPKAAQGAESMLVV